MASQHDSAISDSTLPIGLPDIGLSDRESSSYPQQEANAGCKVLEASDHSNDLSLRAVQIVVSDDLCLDDRDDFGDPGDGDNSCSPGEEVVKRADVGGELEVAAASADPHGIIPLLRASRRATLNVGGVRHEVRWHISLIFAKLINF